MTLFARVQQAASAAPFQKITCFFEFFPNEKSALHVVQTQKNGFNVKQVHLKSI
jgi:hypothetical protein